MLVDPSYTAGYFDPVFTCSSSSSTTGSSSSTGSSSYSSVASVVVSVVGARLVEPSSEIEAMAAERSSSDSCILRKMRAVNAEIMRSNGIMPSQQIQQTFFFFDLFCIYKLSRRILSWLGGYCVLPSSGFFSVSD